MNEVLKWYEDNTYYSVKSGNVTFDIQNDDYWEFHRLLTNQCYKLEEKDKEIERLNNVINELEKDLEHEIAVVGTNRTVDNNNPEWWYKLNCYNNILDKLKKLKEGKRNE